MTTAVKVLLAHLRQHIGESAEKRKALLEHCNHALARPMNRSLLHKYIHGHVPPGGDTLIPIMRWLQLEGVIKPGARTVGLFIYTKPLKSQKKAAIAPKRKRAAAIAA